MQINRLLKNAGAKTPAIAVTRVFIFFMILSITLMGCADTSDSSEEISTSGSVSLSFSANSGSGDLVEESSYTADESITLPGDELGLDREEYRLMGWNTQENGTGIDFALGQTITVGELLDILGKEWADGLEVSLYAQWEKGYSVSYDANGFELLWSAGF